MYVREGALVAQDFDMNALVPRGERIPLVTRVGYDGWSSTAFSLSSDGMVVYRSARQEREQLTVLSRSGARLRTFGAAGQFFGLRVSPDGRKLAVGRLDPRTELSSIWVIDLRDGHEALVAGGADSAGPVWTADGKGVLYARAKAWAVFNVHVTDLQTGRDEVVVDTESGNLAPYVALPDGTVLYSRPNTTTGVTDQLWRVKPGAPAAGEQVVTASPPFDVRVSPDGRWMTYASILGGRTEIFLQGYPSGPREQVTSGGGDQAEWSGDGREIYFLTDNRTKLNAAPVVTSPTLHIGAPVVLFEMPRVGAYTVAPDGNTFYVTVREPPTRPPVLRVLVNWLGK